jgi:hypothetical protein
MKEAEEKMEKIMFLKPYQAAHVENPWSADCSHIETEGF